MLSTLSEKKLHAIRWGVFLAWCLLIISLFYDPVSAVLTSPETTWSWLADKNLALPPDQCIRVQGSCLSLEAYAIGTRVFWGMVVPSAIFIVLVFGHEFWRRICPLYFFSQLPRALKVKPFLNIEQNAWLKQNHFYVQFVLFYLGITARILFVNSDRALAGTFFLFTLLSAVTVVALYGGRSWCHYVCPFGMVQTVFTGPRGLLSSKAHTAPPYSITQSMCRAVDGQGNEESACVSCKSSCMDIDSEQAYWSQLHKPGRKLVQYGYLGLVIGYFCYYWLYAGNVEYYFSGVWSHEVLTLDGLLGPGFYLFGQPIPVPKLLAAPLTLATFAMVSCWLCTHIERYYRGVLKSQGSTATLEKILHRLFSVCTFLAFNIFFVYGGRPEINNLPIIAQFCFQSLIVMVSSVWLYRTWGRSAEQYERESVADKQRRLLRKLPMDVDELLEGRSLHQLDPQEAAILAKTLPQLMPASAPPNDSQSQSPGLALPKTVMRRGRPSTSKTKRHDDTNHSNRPPKTHLR